MRGFEYKAFVFSQILNSSYPQKSACRRAKKNTAIIFGAALKKLFPTLPAPKALFTNYKSLQP
jgi:hypothetical protein